MFSTGISRTRSRADLELARLRHQLRKAAGWERCQGLVRLLNGPLPSSLCGQMMSYLLVPTKMIVKKMF